MKIFTVLSMDDYSKRLSLEPYPSLEVALMRAAWIARHIYGLVPNEVPHPQKTGYSTDVEYVVFQDNESVVISILEQEMREVLPHFRGNFIADGDLSGSVISQTVAAVVPPPPVDDAMDPKLPAGWAVDGTPVRMDTLISDAENIEHHYDLTTDQRFALAIARISKRPNFSFLTDIGVLVQSSALGELKRKTEYGWQIMESEMEFLDQVRISNIVYDYDEINY